MKQWDGINIFSTFYCHNIFLPMKPSCMQDEYVPTIAFPVHNKEDLKSRNSALASV